VLLGFDMAEAACDGLMGIAVHRPDHPRAEAYWLGELKTFVAV
jgi:hypothetical protein